MVSLTPSPNCNGSVDKWPINANLDYNKKQGMDLDKDIVNPKPCVVYDLDKKEAQNHDSKVQEQEKKEVIGIDITEFKAEIMDVEDETFDLAKIDELVSAKH